MGSAIRDPLDRLFLQRRTASRRLFPDSWDLVGGHLEAGESILQALSREIHEETGWTLSGIVANLGVMNYTGDDGIARREIDFLVDVEGDLNRPMLEAGMHEQPRWVGREDALRLLRPEHPGEALVRQIVELAFDAIDEERRRDTGTP